jgi:hypothetical protein
MLINPKPCLRHWMARVRLPTPWDVTHHDLSPRFSDDVFRLISQDPLLGV